MAIPIGQELIKDRFGEVPFGGSELSSGTYDYGGNRYQVSDTGHGTRVVNLVGDLSSINAQQALADQKAATQTAISTLQKSKESIAPIYKSKQDILQSNLDPTAKRYEELLNQVTQAATQDINKTTVNTKNELGRRGITTAAGIGAKELQDVLSPINQSWESRKTDVVQGGEAAKKSILDSIAELANQMALQLLGVDTNIAQVQAQGGNNAAQLALQLSAQQQAAAQAAADQAYKQSVLNQSTKALSSIDLGDKVVMVDGSGNIVSSMPKGKLPSSDSSTTAASLLKSLTNKSSTTKPFDWSSFGLDLASPSGSSATLKNYQGF